MAYQSYGPRSPEAPVVERSPVESRTFGIDVGRLDYGLGADPVRIDLAAALDAADCDLVLLRYPLQRLDITEQLRTCGRPTIHADPLLYYTRVPASQEHAPVRIRRLAEADLPELDEVIAAVFPGHPNHYQVNPLTRTVDIVAAYQEWARATMSHPQRRVYLADVAGVGVAGMFMVQQWGPDAGDFEVLLGGMMPAARGRGWYRAMFRAITDLAHRDGARLAFTAAQASNIASIRGFTATGYHPHLALATVHVLRAGIG